MLTDDFLVTATIDVKNAGKTRLVTCGSDTFSTFYALEIETGVINNNFHIVKGSGAPALLDGGVFSAAAIQKYATVNRVVNIGDTVGVRLDRETSTVRAYHNGVQITSLPVPKWEIPHGDGYRHWGVAQGVDLVFGVLNFGVEFTSVTVQDFLPPPLPDQLDTFASNASLANWNVLSGAAVINVNWYTPNSFGPNTALFTKAAALRTTQMASDSAKITITAGRYDSGKLVVVLCSNTAMTNWMGIQMNSGLFDNTVDVVVGTGPITYTPVGTRQWQFTPTGEVLSFYYDHPTKTIGCYPGHNLSNPIIEWADDTNMVGHGVGHRYTGFVWETSLLAKGIQPMRWEAYNR
jgi:hypothetical protein